MNRAEWIWISSVALVIFLAGWFSHKLFTKPVTQTVTIKVPVEIGGGAPRPEKPSANGTVIDPGVGYTDTSHQPQPPDDVDDHKPTWVTSILVPTHKPVKVFTSNDLVFVGQEDEKVKVRLDTRVWARYEDGSPVLGLHADNSFSTDRELTLPVRAKVNIPKPRPWAIGAKHGLNSKDWGTWLERDIEFIRIGLDLDFTKDHGTQATARLGLRF